MKIAFKILFAFLLTTTAQHAKAQDPLDWLTPAPVNTDAESDTRRDFSPQLTTDGQGNWIATWIALPIVDGSITGDSEVYYAVYDIVDKTWSQAGVLNTDAETDEGDESGVQVTTDGLGNWIAVWARRIDKILYAKYDIENDSWSPPAQITAATSVTSAPQLTTDGQGNWIAVWYVTDTVFNPARFHFIETVDIQYAVYDIENDVWSTPALLNPDSPFDSVWDSSPKLTTDGHGNWIAVWNALGLSVTNFGWEFEIFYAVYDVDNDSWSLPALVRPDALLDSNWESSPQLTTDGQGNWIAVWSSRESGSGSDSDIYYAVYDVENDTWSLPERLSTNADSEIIQEFVRCLATDGKGTWITTWGSRDTSNDERDIVYSTYDIDTDTWSLLQSPEIGANSDTTGNSTPNLATDGKGNWVAIWSSETILEETIGSDSDIVFSEAFIPVPEREKGGSGNSTCFIATAAYGTPLTQEIDILREFRDFRLLTNPFGAAFVDSYYRISPPLADLVSRHPALASLVRALISPIVALISFQKSPAPVTAVVLAILALITLRNARRKNAYQSRSSG